MDSFPKQPSERYTIAFDYTDRLPPNRSLGSAAISATNIATGADATATVIDTPTATIVGNQIQFTIKAGTSTVNYKITAAITLDNGHTLKDDLTMTVLNA